MSTILESVNTLSEKLGVTEREQTIKDQLDLCVERLGGEGNSKDIAESAEKFAEKEDGTARLGTRLITENDTYTALDDELDGYSSVTVNVASGGETFEVNVAISGQGVITVDKTYSEIKAAIDNNKVIVGDVNFADLLHVNIGCGCVSDIIKNGTTQTTDAVILTTEVYVQSFGSSPESTQNNFVIKSDNTYELIENGIYY